MKTVKLFKTGQKPVYPYECEVPAYEADGWSTVETKSPVKTNKSEPKLKTNTTKKEA